MDYLKTQGKFGKVIADLVEKYRVKIDTMIKEVIKKEGQDLIHLLEQIRDAIIKIITGNDVEMLDDEVVGNIFDDRMCIPYFTLFNKPTYKKLNMKSLHRIMFFYLEN